MSNMFCLTSIFVRPIKMHCFVQFIIQKNVPIEGFEMNKKVYLKFHSQCFEEDIF